MRIRTNRRKPDTAPGEDSFLDIVANLVGVLIILVVVVGANAGSKIRDVVVSQFDEQELQDLDQKHASVRRTARSLQRDNDELENRILMEHRLADQRQRERRQLLVQIETARRHLASRKADLSQEHQDFLTYSDRIGKLRTQLSDINVQLEILESSATEHQTIEHYPTPIAKTVFSDELHFRLRYGRLVHVPMDELIELMKDEWQETARKLDVSSETLETVGPVGDFRLQYQLRAEQVKTATSYGELTRRTPQFTRFVMVPISESIGEPLSVALRDNSMFRRMVDASNPARTTVSVWVYPESFAEFNELKRWLYQRGFKTACWPLSKNSPISGGPSGYRSTAQ